MIVSKTLLVIVLWLNDGTFKSSVTQLEACPPITAVQQKYEELKGLGAFRDLTGLCATVRFRPEKKEEPKD